MRSNAPRRLGAFLLPAVLAQASASAGDRLLVASFTSDGVTRHDAVGGAYQDAFRAGVLDGVLGLAVGPDGAIHVCSEQTNRVERFDGATGAYLGPFVADDPATPGDETGGLNQPAGIAFGPDGAAYVASFAGDSVLRYDAVTGAFLGVHVAAASGGLNGPDAGLAFGPDGDLYVPSYFGNRIERYAADGAPLGDFVGLGSGLLRPRTILFRGAFAYVASEGNDRVLEVDAATGALVRNLCLDDPATAGIDESGPLDAPSGIAFGPDGRLYVASLLSNQVLRYDLATGHFVDVFVAAGAGGIAAPTFLLFRPDAVAYGTTAPNSVGPGAHLVAHGFTSVTTAALALSVDGAPPIANARFLCAAAPGQVPFGAGTLWIERTSSIAVGAVQLDVQGQGGLDLDFAAPTPLPFVPGVARYFQLLYRDLATGEFNLSGGLAITFSP